MNETGVHKTVDVLLKLLTQEQWEVRHGGLLGIKYALAVRQVVIYFGAFFLFKVSIVKTAQKMKVWL